MKRSTEIRYLLAWFLIPAVLPLATAVAGDVVVQQGVVDVNDLHASGLITTKDLNASGSITAQDVDASGTMSGQDVEATGDITAGGMVGIGTASPSEKLDVVGDMTVSGDGSVGGDMTVTDNLIAGGFQTPTRYCEFQSIYDGGGVNCEWYFLGPKDQDRLWFGFFGDGQDGDWEPAFGIHLRQDGTVRIGAHYGDGVLGLGNNHIDIPSSYKLRFNSEELTINHDGYNARMDYGDTQNDVLRLSGKVSALGYDTRTTVYDKSRGAALDWIKDSSAYMGGDGKIEHSAFYGYVRNEVADYDKPEVEYYDEILHGKAGGGKTVQMSRTAYPHKKIEEGVSLDEEIAVLRQAIYELKQEVQKLKEK